MSKYFFCTENGGICAKRLSPLLKNAHFSAFFRKREARFMKFLISHPSKLPVCDFNEKVWKFLSP
jgi:hypothetical protein